MTTTRRPGLTFKRTSSEIVRQQCWSGAVARYGAGSMRDPSAADVEMAWKDANTEGAGVKCCDAAALLHAEIDGSRVRIIGLDG
jgi:hypothetical protein